ncbi:mitogen-activated protein kinase kinase kinase [Acanthamoeba castellanii str. Neff]|uniref:Mitogen-activated protein kinase kinase kinase n=1 Tax=Acanthamoeba castellanii (strain ATCC 30010 / Neff) TaxID=1257118 RepID=L8GHF6_ACACF|nr:mitogen-activated protein kinase kinase kinase [Acanthamoeba castellanii str. Neff]ELR12284.1 mitogen-activated protein kinase kinase kinase [Acanthamoeba castellanii str. Neff]
MKRTFVLAATCLLGLLAVAQAQMDCGAGFFGDANGCCPTLIDGLAYFPDSQGCYPLSLESGVFYADENGCYPNENVLWLAPEILENKAYTEKADVYSLGVIFWELLTKERFFGHVKFMSILEDMVKEGQRPAIPDSCIPSYKQLIERCWAQVPEERPSCKEIVERINAIIQGVCPDIATYDADADATFKAKLEREAELRLRHDKQLRQKRQQKVRAAQRVNVNVRAVGAAEPKTRVLTQSIKELAASRCSKGDIIEFMEEFLKLRKESLQRQVDDDPDEPDDDGGDAGVAAGAKFGGGDAVQRAKKAEEERRWIDEFLSRLESEKAAPPKRDVVTPPPDDDDAADSDSDSDGAPDSMASPPPKAPGSAYQESPPLSPLAASSRRGLMVSGVLRGRDGIPAPLSPQPRKAGSYRGPAPPRSPSLDDFKSPSLSNSGGDWRSTSARTGQRADGLGSTRSLSGLTPPSSDADKSDRTLTDAPPETPHASAAANEAAPALTPGKTDDDPAAAKRRPTVSGWSMGTRSAPTPRRDDAPRSALVTGQTLAASAPEPSAAAPTTTTSSWSKSTSWNAARGRTNTLSTRGPTQPDTP